MKKEINECQVTTTNMNYYRHHLKFKFVKIKGEEKDKNQK